MACAPEPIIFYIVARGKGWTTSSLLLFQHAFAVFCHDDFHLMGVCLSQ